MSHASEVVNVQLEIAGMVQCTLAVKRRPLYLRFVWKLNPSGLCSRTRHLWDALDQLDDTPEAAEEIIVAACVGKTTVHLDTEQDGKRVGVWGVVYRYAMIEHQPPGDVLRDSAKWTDWVTSLFTPG
jgi:hypothetical protein